MNKLKALLGFDPKTTTVKTELVAGMTTFLTMCYILAVNPTILATTGMDTRELSLLPQLSLQPSPPSCWLSWQSCLSPRLLVWD